MKNEILVALLNILPAMVVIVLGVSLFYSVVFWSLPWCLIIVDTLGLIIASLLKYVIRKVHYV